VHCTYQQRTSSNNHSKAQAQGLMAQRKKKKGTAQLTGKFSSLALKRSNSESAQRANVKI